MKVIAGRLGGRQFEPSRGPKTHPMSEKARGGLFNVLGDIEGLTVLDAFAGTGALSFEAISRGAASAVAIDTEPSAHLAINKNIRSLGLVDSIKSIRANASSWSDNNQQYMFDIVMCDPPFDNIKPDLLQKLARHTEIGGLVVFSLPSKFPTKPAANSYQLLVTKSYGDAQLVFYRRIS